MTSGIEFVQLEFEFGITSEILVDIEILDKDPSNEYTFKLKQKLKGYMDANPFEFFYIKLHEFLSRIKLDYQFIQLFH